MQKRQASNTKLAKLNQPQRSDNSGQFSRKSNDSNQDVTSNKEFRDEIAPGSKKFSQSTNKLFANKLR